MVRSLLQRNAALATWLTDLGATGLAAAAALARLGTPPSDDLVRALAEAARQFAALRDEVLAAEATIELATPPADALASTRHLEPVLAVLLERLEHRDDPDFGALAVWRDGARKLDDDKWATLEDAVAAAFGRSLAVAATRGRLVSR
jgi:glutamate/tyrosine decarboxylase-like PLP-dependent enzyme